MKTVYCCHVKKDIPPCPKDCNANNIFTCIVNTKQDEDNQ